VSALTLALIRVREPKPEPQTESFRTEVSAGIRHIWKTIALRQIVLGVGLAILFVGFEETLIFVVIDKVLHRPPSFLGVLSALQGAGAIAGGLTAPRLLRRLGDTKLVGLGLVVFAVGDGLWLVPSLAAICVGFAIAGAGLAWLIVAFVTSLQVRTPLAIQGRVSAAASIAIGVPQTVSIAVGAGLSALVDYRILIAVVFAVTALCGVWLSSRREAQPEPALA
jgi:Na+/melibiose symporter-like transporter